MARRISRWRRHGVPTALSGLLSVSVAVLINLATSAGARLSTIVGLVVAMVVLAGWEGWRAVRAADTDLESPHGSTVDQDVNKVRGGRVTGWRGATYRRSIHVRQRTGDVSEGGEVTGVDADN